MGGYPETPDAELLERWRVGDTDALEQLLRRHLVAIVRFIEHRTAGLGGVDVEDLAQRTFEAVVPAAGRIHGDFRAYLFGIARHVISRARAESSRGGPHVPPSRADLLDPGTSPSVSVARRELRFRLEQLVDDLPDDFAVVVRDFYLEGRSIGEIAEHRALPVGTVKSRLSRGRTLLQDRAGIDIDRHRDT